MKIVLRWFGPGQDPVPLQHIRQIPGISGIAGCLLDIPTGQVWPMERIRHLAQTIADAGLEFEVVESLNIHEDIKLGLADRDQLIENYLVSMERLAQVGIRVICYNFMAVFDWFRTELRHKLPDGSEVLYYNAADVEGLSPETVLQRMLDDPQGMRFPGWEPEQKDRLQGLFEAYGEMTPDRMRQNLGYFLDAVVPRAQELGISMALHPDDPPWSIFGLPRLAATRDDLRAVLDLCQLPGNGLTLCTGSLGANLSNDIPAMVREFGGPVSASPETAPTGQVPTGQVPTGQAPTGQAPGSGALSPMKAPNGLGRIPFVHLRNILHEAPGIFSEASHLSSDGSLDMVAILRAFKDIGFEGYLRPDHGRMIWGENGRPGYGLYDRALGIAYINGIWETLGT